MKKQRARLALVAILGATVLHYASASEAPDPAAADVLDLEQAASLLRVPPHVVRKLAESGGIPARRVATRWRFNRVALMEWLQGDRYAYPAVPKKAAMVAAAKPAASQPSAQASPVAPQTAALGSGLSIAELSSIRGTHRGEPLLLAQASTTTAPPASSPDRPIGEQQTGPTAEETALRDQGLSLLKGRAKTLEFGLAYSRQVIDADTQRVEVLTTTATLTGRYGLADDLQLTARLPFNYRRTRVLGDPPLVQDVGAILLAIVNNREPPPAEAGTGPTSSLDRYAGDLTANLLGVGLRENVGRPNVFWSVDAVLPTGPGDMGLGAGIVLSKSYDPVVLFAGANYLHGIRVDHTDPRRTLAKHNVGFNFGYAYAINDAIALSGQFAGTYRTARSTSTLPPERESYLLQLGLTWQLGRGLFIDPNIAFGIGGISPDLTFSTNVVYSF